MTGVRWLRAADGAAILAFALLISSCGSVDRIDLANGDRFCVPKRLAPPREMYIPADTDGVLGISFLACERPVGPEGKVCVLPEEVRSANVGVGKAVARTRWGDIHDSAAMQSLMKDDGTVVRSDEGRGVTYVEQSAVGVDEVFIFYGAAVGSLTRMPEAAELALICDRGPVVGGMLPRASGCRRFVSHGRYGIDYSFEPRGDVVSQVQLLDGAVTSRVESFRCK